MFCFVRMQVGTVEGATAQLTNVLQAEHGISLANLTATADIWTAAGSDYTSYFKYGAYTCTVLFGVWIVIGVVLFAKFIVAIRIIQEASSALRAMPMLVFFPFITVAAIAG